MTDQSACETQAETARGTRALLDRRRPAGSLRPRLAGGTCDPLVTYQRFTQTDFVWVYFSSASRPWSRPKPDSLKPPKGSAGS
jgi:hypothetical protein